jgi:glycosyltransferase involved in cell wall biosynthesis
MNIYNNNNNNINVLMFGWELPPYNSGGLGVACYGLAKGLTSQGVNISFALPRVLPYNIPFMKILDHHSDMLSLTAINSLMRSYMTNQDYFSLTQSANRQQLSLYGANLYEEAIRFGDMAASWAKSEPCQIIHAHDWMTYPAGMSAKRVCHQPFVAHVHATEFDRTGGNVDQRIAELEYQGLTAADQVITVSGYTKDVVNRYYGINKDKITVVHNGVDPVEFTAADIRRVFPNDHIALYVGRLTFQKGIEYFLRAAQEVLTYHPDTVFIVAGDGDMFTRHVLESAYLGISSRVIFTGFLTGQKLHSLYQMADVFVMPSVSEPYGLVVLEALASGVPCIVSKQSGVIESVKNLYTVDFWDTHKMAGLINTVLSHPELSKQMVHQAQQELKSLTWDHAARKTLSVYQSLL